MKQQPYRVLILCTGNSARSILGEYILRAKGKGRFDVYSAGSRPTGIVNPLAVQVLLDRYTIDARDARSKSWNEFQGTVFDFVITVCDNAKEACPIWPGQPSVAHWGSPDPAAFEGTFEEKYRFFASVASQIARRAELFCSFPDDKLSNLKAVNDVGLEYRLADEDRLAR